ncbi:MAG: hypothetical protein AMXMBFR13_18900 [Phycisphaerae bacterium]
MRMAELLEREHINYDLDVHPQAFTAMELARVEHVSSHQVIKPVIIEADGRLMMCALPADHRLEIAEVKEALGAREVRLLSESELPRVCADCELGAEPPVGSLYGLQTLMDESIRQEDSVLFQAGTHHSCIRMQERDFELVSQPKVARISRPA